MDISELARFLAALIFIVGLIGLCAFAAKRFNLMPGMTGFASGTKRLALIEVKALDTKHRLLLIRRDDREHLVLIGGDQPVVVESGIEAPIAPALSIVPAAPAGEAAQMHPQMKQFIGTMPAPVQKIFAYLKERRA